MPPASPSAPAPTPRRLPPWLVAVACLGVAPAAIGVTLLVGPDPRAAEAALPLHARGHDYAGATTCRGCHPDHFASWRRTYHSTMTQLPSARSVLGRFDGVPVEAYGAAATPVARDGRFFMKLPDAAAGEREAEIALTVGSRRYQQYFERVSDDQGTTYQRLPLLWNVVDERWMHLNGVFLEPDNDNWNAHRATWNQNCVFCHNTGVAPGLPEKAHLGGGGGFDSHVADLGIACEACHGPGDAHAREKRSLVGRYVGRMSGAPLPNPLPGNRGEGIGGGGREDVVAKKATVVAPSRLGQAESAALCGQCHSQRLPDPLEKLWTYLDTGPTFRPGGTLAGHVVPLTRDTPVPDPAQPEDTFRQRFWSDGTARLTAYEYLGVTQSPCFKGGVFTCTSCHTMHGGEIAGQLPPEMRGDRACTQCHTAIGQNVAAHTHHRAESSGSRCLDCHMPRIVFGVLDIHRSHRVESPDVGRDVEGGRPNACTLCHVDRNATWAAEQSRAFWGERYRTPTSRPGGGPLSPPEALISLHAGDPVQRAVTFAALGRPGIAVAPNQRGFVLGNVLVGLGDGYGGIRTLARRAALSLDGTLNLGLHDRLAAYDVQAARSIRDPALGDVIRAFESAASTALPPPPAGRFILPDYHLDRGLIRDFLGRQADRAISIGE